MEKDQEQQKEQEQREKKKGGKEGYEKVWTLKLVKFRFSPSRN